MKIKTVLLGVLCAALLFLAAGCGCQSNTVTGSGETTFKGVVTDMDDDSITVKPNKDQYEASIAEEIIVTTNIAPAKKPPALAPGKSVFVTYDGTITEGNPAHIDGVIEINFVDIKGNRVENN